MKKMFILAVVCSFLSFSYALQTTPLTLNVDTNANELWFTGTTTVTPFVFAGNDVTWSITEDIANTINLDISSGVSATGLSSSNFILNTDSDNISVSLSFTDSSNASVAGNGIHIDYSGAFTAQMIQQFENKIANYTSISSFSGYPITNTPLAVNVVPEPITMALLGLGGLALRRRKA